MPGMFQDRKEQVELKQNEPGESMGDEGRDLRERGKIPVVL